MKYNVYSNIIWVNKMCLKYYMSEWSLIWHHDDVYVNEQYIFH